MSLKETDKYLAALEASKKMVVAVGVTSDAGYTYPNGATVQQVANSHEFGIGVPRRSFLREPFRLKNKAIEKFTQQRFQKVLSGSSPKRELGLVGVFCENISVDAFSSGGNGQWADISDATKRKKGSTAILIADGDLRQSISSEVRA